MVMVMVMIMIIMYLLWSNGEKRRNFKGPNR
jgi:hypothetical protein